MGIEEAAKELGQGSCVIGEADDVEAGISTQNSSSVFKYSKEFDRGILGIEFGPEPFRRRGPINGIDGIEVGADIDKRSECIEQLFDKVVEFRSTFV